MTEKVLVTTQKQRFVLLLEKISEYSLYVLLFCLPFSKAMIEICLITAMIAWILKKVISCSYRDITSDILFYPLLFYVACNIFSVIISVDPALSLYALVSKTLEYVVLYFLVVDTIKQEKQLKRLLLIIGAAVFLVTIDGIVQYITGNDFLRSYSVYDDVKMRACFTNPNNLAGWLIVMIPFLVISLIAGKELIYFQFQKYCVVLLLALSFICLLYSYSRSAFLGVVCGIVFIWHSIMRTMPMWQHILVYCLVLLIFIGVLFVAPQTIKDKAHSIIGQNIFINRTFVWKRALQIIRDFYYVGCGLNTYSMMTRKYDVFYRENYNIGVYAHNCYLQMAAEIGVIGLISFLIIIFRFFWYACLKIKQNKNALFLTGTIGGLIGYLIQSFFDTHLYSLQLATLFWFIMGLAVACIQIAPSKQTATVE